MFELNRVRYKKILDIPRLFIPAAKVTCIMGESGGGKTTLLKLLNHLISPDSGEVRFLGKNILEYSPVKLRREVVMLPQTPIIFPGNVAHNLNLGLRFAEKPLLPNEKLEEVLEKVNLAKKLDSPTEELSGGEKQRLALARIILMKPPVLLLDEPSSALDEGTEKLVLEAVLNYIRREKKTLVMVTHSRTIAANYADLAVTVNGGCIAGTEEVGANGRHH